MKEYYLDQGFSDYLTKPIKPLALNEVINKWLIPNHSTPLPFVFSMAVAAKQLNKLNHYKFSFESGRKIDEDYYQRFISFLEPLGADELIKAAKRRDIETIRQTLPLLIESVQQSLNYMAQIADAGDITEIVHHIKTALLAGDTVTAGNLVKQMEASNLTSSESELCFSLYDLLLNDETEKTLQRIDEWLKS
jgi:CheY-like chemotaxis protein